MPNSDIRGQLERALERGIRGLTPPGATVQPARRSAVLVLFGELDRVPATFGSATHTTVPAELDVLLTRRSGSLRNHAGQIAFPGGGVEPADADRASTALREAHEETGLDPAGVDVLGQLPDAHIPVSGYTVSPVVGWWRLPSQIAADNLESTEVLRVPVAELIDPAARFTSVLRRDGTTFRGPAFRLGQQFGGHLVWGFTAMLLAGLFDALEWSLPWDRSRTADIDA